MTTQEPEDHYIGDDPTNLGNINIHHSVIKSIVRLSALEVDGVCGIATGFVDSLGGISELFSKKESDRGVKVSADAEDNYEIEIRLILAYGCDIPKTAQNVQLAVRDRINSMTGKTVTRVNVIVDGIKMRGDRREARPVSENWIEEGADD